MIRDFVRDGVSSFVSSKRFIHVIRAITNGVMISLIEEIRQGTLRLCNSFFETASLISISL